MQTTQKINTKKVYLNRRMFDNFPKTFEMQSHIKICLSSSGGESGSECIYYITKTITTVNYAVSVLHMHRSGALNIMHTKFINFLKDYCLEYRHKW